MQLALLFFSLGPALETVIFLHIKKQSLAVFGSACLNLSLGRLRQEDCLKFKARLRYRAKPCLNAKTKEPSKALKVVEQVKHLGPSRMT